MKEFELERLADKIANKVVEKMRGLQGLGKLYTREDVAEYFGCCTATIRNYEKLGYIPRVELSDHRVRYRQSDVEKLIQKKVRLRTR